MRNLLIILLFAAATAVAEAHEARVTWLASTAQVAVDTDIDQLVTVKVAGADVSV